MNEVHRLYRVVRVPETGAWRVRAANGAFASPSHATRDAAEAYAKGLAQGHGWARIILHAEDGSIEREFVFGRDRREHDVPGRGAAAVFRPSYY